jgi:hypothetical protein
MLTVALFARLEAKAGKEKEVAKVPGNRTCDGQSRSDHAYMARAKVGADARAVFQTAGD